jgi:phosphopantetheinyl transferase
MISFNIFTESKREINFQYFDKSRYLSLDEHVLYLIHTDSYSPDAISLFKKSLSDQELEKAFKFRFIEDQYRYIVTHATLRTILGRYLKTEPAEIEFVSNTFGKPSLSEKYEKIHFNLSHSKGLSALAFSTKSEIGIDIERIDPKFDFEMIADAHFSKSENHFLHAKKLESRNRFYTLWTRKEAFLKAVGIGIGENIGIEVFRRVNHFRQEMPLPEIQGGDFYLKTFLYQNQYLITSASNNASEVFCQLVDL